MTVTEYRNSLKETIKSWKDQIICFFPQREGYGAYFVDSKSNKSVNYIRANCDELRHLATNYDLLLIKIKSKHYGYLKEAVLNTVKYEATRRAFKKQHEWIQNSYKLLIEKQQLSAEQQESQIKQLKLIIREQKQEVTAIKSECRDRLAAIQSETLLQQKKAKIEQKNCDREINHLQSELNKGLHELKLKYRWLIAQFIQERAKKQQSDRHNKSLQTCQNLFKKAQRKLNFLQCENKLLIQENVYLRNNTKMLRV